jgi:hypothetical protein
METSHANCQSCGMPLRRDPLGGGTNADGSKSRAYCSHCYANGHFTRPDITAREMQARVHDKLRERGIPRILSWMFTRRIPRLQRWSGGAGKARRVP